MVVFWIFAILMVALAFAFIIPPLLGKGRTVGVNREELNVEIFKDRQRELGIELKNGVLTAEQHEQAVSELQRDLLFNADDEAAPVAVKEINNGRWASIVVGLVVPVLAIGLYLTIGNADLIGKDLMNENAQAGGHNPAAMNKMITDLQQRLQDEPNDSEGWGILARSLMQAERFSEAADAYAKAYELIGDNPGLMAEYAEALTMAAGGSKAGLATELVNRVLEIEPMNPRALWLAGSIAYQQDDFRLAVERWSPLLSMIPPGSREEQAVREAIAEATGKGGLGTASSSASASSGRINLRVELPAALQGKVSSEDAVFVYARALEGPPMPIAIKRFLVKDLPVNVMLDDSAAMMANRKLSMFREVNLMARVSKSGNAKAEAGDLKGEVVARVGDTQVVNILINEEIQADGSAKALVAGAKTAVVAPSANDGNIKLYVELSAKLKAMADANDTVFIYARAMQGPPMPIAIKRLQVKDLPVKVVLDDSSAMMPNRKLSMFDQVGLMARVSKSGNATSVPGDLQGEQSGKVGSGKLVELVIDQVIK